MFSVSIVIQYLKKHFHAVGLIVPENNYEINVEMICQTLDINIQNIKDDSC